MAKGQTQTLYSLAAVLGLVESGNKEDPFHMIVYRISGKTSVRELTPPEAAAVEAELRQQLREQRPKKKTASPEYPGKMTAGQKAYAWRLLYDLAKLSPSGGGTHGRHRPKGIAGRPLPRSSAELGQTGGRGETDRGTETVSAKRKAKGGEST